MNHYKKKSIPYGFPFLDVDATRRLDAAIEKAESVLKKEGYLKINPATIDYPETFSGYESFDSFRLRDHLGEDLSLRNDVTVQVIKGFANQLEEKDQKISKFYYSLRVFRDIRKSYPQLREIYQVGAECIGIDSEKSVFQLIEASHRILSEKLGLEPVFLIGHVGCFQLLKNICSNYDLRETVRKKNAPALSEMMQKAGWPAGLATTFSRTALFYEEKEWKLMIEKGRTEKSQIADFLEKFDKAFHRVKNYSKKLRSLGINIQSEPLLVRKTDYYTGYIFEGFIPGLSEAPLRGGVYDNLVEEYSGQSLPAAGFALDISAISKIR